MSKKDIKQLIYFMNHSKMLTHEQQLWRDKLIERDITKKIKPIKRQAGPTQILPQHNPASLALFMGKFSRKGDPLKFTTHKWDDNEFGGDFNLFIERIRKSLLKEENGVNLETLKIYNNHLYFIIYNFLLNTGASNQQDYYWGKYKIKIGYQNPNSLREWMQNNPNTSPFSFPLKELPEKYQIKDRIKGKRLTYWGEVVEVFKNAIEFRGSSFRDTVEGIFMSSDYSVNNKKIETLDSVRFYTDTQRVEESLDIIEENIRQRCDASNKVDIWCDFYEGTYTLHILHVGSFSDTSINDKKITLKEGTGRFSDIKEKLQSLCDFSIVSRFKNENGEKKAYRVDYLYDKDLSSPKFTPLDEDCQGFEYILKFYE